VFNLEVLAMRQSLIAALTIGFLLVKAVVNPAMGAVFDRRGARWSMYVCGAMYTLFFASIPLSAPDRLWPLFAGWALAGAADALFTVAYTATLYAFVPATRGRPAYFAVANLLVTAANGVGALVAVPLLEGLRGVSLSVGPLHLGQFHLFYGLCALAMVPATLSSRWVPSRRRRP
jgi:MFS family permease